MSSLSVSLSKATPPTPAANQRRMALAHTLRFARGARGVQDHGGVAASTGFHCGFEKAWMFAVIGPAQHLQRGKGHQLGLAVMAHAAFVVIGDVGDVRVQGLEFEQLVDLLLVFDDGVADFRILQHVGHVGGRRVLVQRHRHAAQALRGQHGPVQAGTVVADDGQVHAALEADGGQAAGQRAHLVVDLEPRSRSARCPGLFRERRVCRIVLAPCCSKQPRKSRHGCCGSRLHQCLPVACLRLHLFGWRSVFLCVRRLCNDSSLR